jgi:hypothetical protein
MEYWNDGVRRKKTVVSDFDSHYSTIPTIHHSNSSKDYAQGQGSHSERRETPEICRLLDIYGLDHC